MSTGSTREGSSSVLSEVMPRDESSGPAIAIEQREVGGTAASAIDHWVWLAWPTKVIPLAVSHLMFPAGDDLKVLRSVVGLNAVLVMDDFTASQGSPQYFGSHKTVFVNVTTCVGHRVARPLDQYVSVGGDSPTAFPARARLACWNAGLHISVTGDVNVEAASAAMGINWMTGDELSQAIPPAYCEYIGTYLYAAVESLGAAA